MAKQLNVNLAFNADTGKAKAQIQDLQHTLNNLVKTSAASNVSAGKTLTKDLMEAQVAASKLQTVLNQSMNVKTGNLDLTKFSEGLNKAGLKIEDLGKKLDKLGPEGQKAFMSLTQSIVAADVPLRRTNQLVSEMWTTMKNTARWQLSSSVLHGFMGSLQQAMGYAKDLDQSLNDIRIVTNASADEMAAFADRANKAAKALSATTTQYTKASLIYYQQGLSDQEVQDRADITIKMAHASGQSAEIVSDQLTAVWNNFAKGGENLEYYADVITALGAATASSSDEIAGGLEKFASIAEMIGLSYEYAASALATITATTRQSEDVVGTALKTIFARIQGLNLGETLDDGTTLNKYSKALEKVGISIFEQNGELKNMDSILNEMGAKWETLSKDQQVALAQTVAGVRQYNQLVSLMDNWDFMQENLELSRNSEGTLQEQADIYAESWQAARDRVKAAAQDIYDSILDPDFFITFLNLLEDVLTGVANLTDALGGLPGVFGLIGAVGTRVFGKQLAESVDRMVFNFRSFTGETQKTADDLRNEALEVVKTYNYNQGTEQGAAEIAVLEKRLSLQDEIRKRAKDLTEEELKQLQAALEINDAYGEQHIRLAKEKDNLSDQASDEYKEIRNKMLRSGADENQLKDLGEATKQIRDFQNTGRQALDFVDNLGTKFDKNSRYTKEYVSGLDSLYKTLSDVGYKGSLKDIDEAIANGIDGEELKKLILEKIDMEDLKSDIVYHSVASSKLGDLQKEFNLKPELIEKYGDTISKLTDKELELAVSQGKLNEVYLENKEAVQNFETVYSDFANSIVSAAQGFSSVVMGLTALKSGFEALNNTDLSTSEKVIQVFSSLAMGIPSLVIGLNELANAHLIDTAAKMKDAAAGLLKVKTEALHALAVKKSEVATRSHTISLWGQVAAMTAADAAGKGMVATLGLMAAGIIALIAVVWILVKAFEALNNSTPEAKLNRLKEETEKAREAFDRLTNSVNETKTAIDGLETSYDKIKNLKEGTAEWNAEIAKTNAQVLELLDKYPQLNEYLQHDENGLLYIDEQGLDLLQQEQQKSLTAASNAYVGAQIREKEEVLNQTAYDKVENTGLSSLPKGMTTTDIFNYMSQQYQNPEFQDMLFTKDGATQIAQALYGENVQSAVIDEIHAMAEANMPAFKDIASQQQSINTLKESQITSQVASMGSVRSLDSALEIALTGTDYGSYENFANQTKEDFQNSFGSWINNGEFRNAEQLELIEEFKKLQGLDGAEYIGQSDGEMKFKVGEEELGFTEDEFTNYMADAKTSEGLHDLMLNGMRSALTDALDFKDVGDLGELSDEAVVSLDNLQHEIISNVYSDVSDSAKRVSESKEAFQAITNAYSGEDGKLQDTELEQLGADTQFIEWNTENANKFRETIQAYDDGKIKIEEVTSALREMNAAGQIEGMGATFVEAANTLGLDEEAATDMHEYAKHLMEIADESEILSDELDEDADAAAKLAIQVTRMNKGIETLAENYEDWGSILKKSSKESAEYSKAMGGIKNALADVLDIEADFISEDFVTEHLADIEKAATGDAEAIDRLRTALGEQLILDIKGVDKFEDLPNNLQTAITQMKDWLANNKIDIGESIELNADGVDDTGFIDKCNEVISSAGMTADEANAYFDSMGFEAEFETEQQPVVKTGRGTRTVTTLEPPITQEIDGIPYTVPGGWEQKTYPGEEYTFVDYVDAIAMETTTNADGSTSQHPKIKKITKKATGAMNNFSSSNSGGPSAGGKKGGGGGKSKGKAPKKVKESDVLDRYKEITDQLDDVTDAFSDASRAADRLYGAARIKEMDKQIALLDKEVALLEKKKEKALEYLKIDKAALDKAAKDAGVSFIYDEKLNIVNYEEQLLPLYTQLNSLIEAAGAEVDEAEQEQIDKLQEKITALKEAITQYDTTKEEYEETEQTQQEKKDEKQDLFYEKLDYKLELKLEIEETSLKKLDYLMNKWSDDFFKSAETAALMYDPKEYDQSDGYRNKLEAYGAQEDELKKQYEAGQISQAKYIEGLKKVQDGYYENLEALVELDKQMLHFYEDTLAAGAEELADYTDHMEHLTGVFDHYLNLMDILGKTKDYEAMGDFLGGKADTLRDRLDVAKEYYDVMLNQKADVEQELNNAIRSGDEESVKFWQEQWDAIVDATDEAQEQVLSLTEEWAEAMRATIDNNMAKIKDTLEKTLTDGMGFDFLMDEFDRLNTRQEEYLTKTNQIYETNKLIRQASQKIDQTDNKVAKQKMENFVAETKALQENNQLSNYELEIQQAKYDLLLAEIALEEAQNAKSTVRMQRDSEGNFGYVYTADQDAISDAEQGVDDAENRLYNLSLDGQKEYTEKYLQAMQDMNDELNEVWDLYYNQKVISEEEMNEQIDAIYAHYYGEGGVFQTYSHLYNIAVQTDADATADFWGKKYGEMTQHTADWQAATDEYLVAVEEQTEEWAKVSEQANKDVEGALKDSSTATKELTQESDKLGKKIRNEVIPDLEDEYDQVMENVKAYDAERDAIQRVIDTYEKRAIQLGKDIASESEKALDDEDEDKTTTSDSKKFRDDYAADIRDLVLNKGFEIESSAVQTLLAERQEKINSDEKWSGMSNEKLIDNIKEDKKKKVASMDTGGFTGVWGPEGKLAFLHQKELVLNEHDTDNMLNTVSMIRELVSMIDAGAAGSMISGLLSTPGFTNMLNHDFQQNIEIYAEFPSATDHTEIEQAFNNLLNTASQYANRK